MQKPKQAKLVIGDETYNLPIMHGSMGPSVIDVSKLYRETGCFTYDPGFSSTASCQSAITFIDGDKSTLLYRGYPIDDLALSKDFSDVSYLLLYGELPDEKQKKEFVSLIKNHTMLHEQVNRFFYGFRRDAHPMAMMVSVTGALSAFYHDELDITDSSQRELVCVRLIAKIPTLAAMAYKYSIGQPFIHPRNELDFVENFLQMCFAVPAEKYRVEPWVSDALSKIFILHADHEQNASTSTVRLAASSGANPYACVAAGIASLWGPSHGGANEAALNMLQQIGSRENIEHFVKKAKDPNDSFRLMGFGHRVYKSYDPRAKVMQQTCRIVLQNSKTTDHILDVAKQLEEIALSDSYFVERKLYPNIDFYSGIILRAIGFPVSLFTVLFAVSRTVGWLAQWKELMEDDKQKIGRPRQLFVGKEKREIDK